MKIEIAESLCYTWLRHVKGCQIAQTNWTSPINKEPLHWNELMEIKTRTEEYFKNKYNLNIFPEKMRLEQILRQSEIDAIGVAVEFQNDKPVLKVCAMDVAFHENGLHYGNNVSKVIAKMLRTALCMYAYFSDKDTEIIFATPKIINKDDLEKLEIYIKELNEVVNGVRGDYKFNFRFLFEKLFKETILKEVLNIIGAIKGTDELFIRSCKLLNLFDDYKIPKLPSSDSEIISDFDELKHDLKIGQLVCIKFEELLGSGLITKRDLENLQNIDYCKTTFGINYPVLVKTDSDYERVRYYVMPQIVDGVSYQLCSQWYERNRDSLKKWFEEIEKR